MSSKRKPPTKVVQPVVKQSAKLPLKASINESKTSISAASSVPTIIPASSIQTIEISSDSSSGYSDLSDDDEDGPSGDEDLAAKPTNKKPGREAPAPQKQQPTGLSRLKAKQQQHEARDEDTEMLSPPPGPQDGENSNGGDGVASDEELTSPTFGDLIRSHETVDVNASLVSGGAQQQQQQQQQEPTPNSVLAPAHPRTIAPPSLSSLGTVLNQALRTDDADLLESCLNTTDLVTVRNTIQRMDSALAGTLLSKLAARMHRRPGRAHSLMSWVQWTLVAHGGALATQPELMRRLTDLNRVLDERARGLSSLLMLKGKLDMLEAQMQLRRGNKARRPGPNRDSDDSDDEGLDDDEEEEEEEGVVYVEGDEDKPLSNGVAAARNQPAAGDVDDELLINGADGSDEEDDDDDDDDEDLDMDEPDVSDGESLDEDEVDHEDVEESADDDDSDVEAAAPPAKMQKTSSKTFPKRR